MVFRDWNTLEFIMATQKQVKWIVSVTAIVALVVMEMYALSQGVNGVMLTFVVGAICAIAGHKYQK